MTILYTHKAFAKHDLGRMHPEKPARLEALREAFSSKRFDCVERRESPAATIEQVMRMHPMRYVESIFNAEPTNGLVQLDGDTAICPGSVEAILRAAGAVCAAVDAVVEKEDLNAFCVGRPPGHHAEPEKAMGFCIFNHVAIGAAHAKTVHQINRLAVVDFDVHHGNGTQAMFWNEPNFLYASTHQMPLYPGTGRREERGELGKIVNVPLSYGDGGIEFRTAIKEGILPALNEFEPEILFISAGFDAHVNDPLAGMRLVEDDFWWVTNQLMEIADAHCEGRIISVLEGGYDLDALAASASAHLSALMANK